MNPLLSPPPWQACDPATLAGAAGRGALVALLDAVEWSAPCTQFLHAFAAGDPRFAQLRPPYAFLQIDADADPESDRRLQAVARSIAGEEGWPLLVVLSPRRTPLLAAVAPPIESRPGRLGLPALLQEIARRYAADAEGAESRAGARLRQAARAKGECTCPGKTRDEALARIARAIESERAHARRGLGRSREFLQPALLMLRLETSCEELLHRARSAPSGLAASPGTILLEHCNGPPHDWTARHHVGAESCRTRFLADQAAILEALRFAAARQPGAGWDRHATGLIAAVERDDEAQSTRGAVPPAARQGSPGAAAASAAAWQDARQFTAPLALWLAARALWPHSPRPGAALAGALHRLATLAAGTGWIPHRLEPGEAHPPRAFLEDQAAALLALVRGGEADAAARLGERLLAEWPRRQARPATACALDASWASFPVPLAPLGLEDRGGFSPLGLFAIALLELAHAQAGEPRLVSEIDALLAACAGAAAELGSEAAAFALACRRRRNWHAWMSP